MKRYILFITLLAICGSTAAQQPVTGPHILLYKTRKNYNNLVPVVLSADRTSVMSYPDTHDIKNRKPPVPLHKGYLLDHAGTGASTAFISMSYTKYAALKQPPSPVQLYTMVKDKNPLTALYDCGPASRYKNAAAELNKLIDAGKLTTVCNPVPVKH